MVHSGRDFLRTVAAVSVFVGTLGVAQPSAASSYPRLQHFRTCARRAVPKALVKTLCSGSTDPIQCARTFRASGRAWMGNISAKGAPEFVIFDGERCGTLGCSYEIYQSQAGQWGALGILAADSDPESPSWITNRPRFDILPTMRHGYHDLRIAVGECVKWDKSQYVPYPPNDYHQLSPLLFDSSNSSEAETFWMIRYAGMSEFTFTPQVSDLACGFPAPSIRALSLRGHAQGPSQRAHIAS